MKKELMDSFEPLMKNMLKAGYLESFRFLKLIILSYFSTLKFHHEKLDNDLILSMYSDLSTVCITLLKKSLQTDCMEDDYNELMSDTLKMDGACDKKEKS